VFIERANLIDKYYKELSNTLSFDIMVQTTEQYFQVLKNSLGISTLGKCYIQNDPEILEIKTNEITFPPFLFAIAYDKISAPAIRVFIDDLLKYCRTTENKEKIF